MNSISIQATEEPNSQEGAASTLALPASVRRLVLTGFMGAGKSTVGRLLAEHLGWTFLDLDAHLEARAGLSVPDLFERHGEAHFRRLESSALASALRQANVILALGGGAPETLTNRLLLEQTPGTVTVFLDAPFPTLFDRCMLQALNPSPGSASRDTASRDTASRDLDRPNLRDAAAAQARFNTRLPLYRRLARLTLDTTALSPGQIVPVLLEELRLRL